MRMLIKSAVIMAVAASAMLSVTGLAKADPPAGVTPAAADIVGVGSDTTEFPLDQFSNDYNLTSPTNKLYSWDATPATPGCPPNGQLIGPAVPTQGYPTSSCILTKTGAPNYITRPNGSSSGINALKNTTSATVDFARSSRARGGSDPAWAANGIGFVLMADDAVTYATATGSSVSSTLSNATLNTIYTNPNNCTAGGVVYKPYLPQTGSGTRNFWLTALGIDPATYVQPACVGTVQENDGTQAGLTDVMALVPYSVSKYIAQADHSAPLNNPPTTPPCTPTGSQNQFGCDLHGTMVLNSPDGLAPTAGVAPNRTIDVNFALSAYGRSVYNVVRYDAGTTSHVPANLQPIFNGRNATPSGYVCSAAGDAILKNYGLLPSSICGTVF